MILSRYDFICRNILGKHPQSTQKRNGLLFPILGMIGNSADLSPYVMVELRPGYNNRSQGLLVKALLIFPTQNLCHHSNDIVNWEQNLPS